MKAIVFPKAPGNTHVERGKQPSFLEALLHSFLPSAVRTGSLMQDSPEKETEATCPWDFEITPLWVVYLHCPTVPPHPHCQCHGGTSWVQRSHTNAPLEDPGGPGYVAACYQEDSELPISPIHFSVCTA